MIFFFCFDVNLICSHIEFPFLVSIKINTANDIINHDDAYLAFHGRWIIQRTDYGGNWAKEILEYPGILARLAEIHETAAHWTEDEWAPKIHGWTYGGEMYFYKYKKPLRQVCFLVCLLVVFCCFVDHAEHC